MPDLLSGLEEQRLSEDQSTARNKMAGQGVFRPRQERLRQIAEKRL